VWTVTSHEENGSPVALFIIVGSLIDLCVSDLNSSRGHCGEMALFYLVVWNRVASSSLCVRHQGCVV
jgi:hypothetical protein